jgi:hypothetical protein
MSDVADQDRFSQLALTLTFSPGSAQPQIGAWTPRWMTILSLITDGSRTPAKPAAVQNNTITNKQLNTIGLLEQIPLAFMFSTPSCAKQ